ncbi:DJ-1/PfpI family protein [Streptomyces sp. NBC_00354]|uniref:DJ-1/PfpI family protein n=1 Tax=Streptomyces sp. NBC_00354 TaxID=2975723 RepID=UPI002E2770B0
MIEAVAVEDAPRPDLLVVPGAGPKQPEPLLDWVASAERGPERKALRQARADGIPLAAACTSTFLLAEAGVLDGLSATTSWWLAPAFRQAYPHVALDESNMLAHADGVITAGAAMAHPDLALALVRQASPVLAELTARYPTGWEPGAVVGTSRSQVADDSAHTDPSRSVPPLRVSAEPPAETSFRRELPPPTSRFSPLTPQLGRGVQLAFQSATQPAVCSCEKREPHAQVLLMQCGIVTS